MPIRSENVPYESRSSSSGVTSVRQMFIGVYSTRMKLYTYFRSSAAFRVRIALNLKGMTYDAVPVDLRPGAHHQPDYLARNPQGLIPALEDAGDVIGQSLATYIRSTTCAC